MEATSKGPCVLQQDAYTEQEAFIEASLMPVAQ